MYNIVGLSENEVVSAESFIDALRAFYALCLEPIAQGRAIQNSETTCYIEARGKAATARMSYPYLFEFAIKAGLIKDGKLVEPLVEPPVTELIAAFSRVAILQMTRGMGCH